MDRRTYLLGTGGAVLGSLAGCAGDDEGSEATSTATETATATEAPSVSAEPAIARFGLIEERDAYDTMETGSGRVDAGATAIFGAEYEVPVVDGAVAYQAVVTVSHDGATVDRNVLEAEESVAKTRGTNDRTAWFEFDTAGWDLAPHTAAFTLLDRHTGAEAGPATFEVTVVEPSFTLAPVSPPNASAVRGGTVDVSITVRNDGASQATKSVEFLLAGEPVDTVELTLAAGAEETLTRTIDTGSFEPGEYDYGFRTPSEEVVGTLRVTEPTPEPVVTSEAIPDPSKGDLEQDGTDFSVVIENRGEAGDIGYALTFFVSQFGDPWSTDVESADTAAFDAGEERTVTLSGDPGIGDEYFGFRVWPATVRAEVTNEGAADGDIEVVLFDESERLDATVVTIASGETQPVTFTLPSPDAEPTQLRLEASVAD